jgi:regulator of sigma E protease
MEIFLIRLLQFLLAISLLVLLHEGGHFFFAKLFGVRVDKFYMFFDPSIGKWDGSIFKFKPKGSHTQYGMGWLPLGGYCKIAGMIDESFDTEQMAQPMQQWEFRAKPAWQRLLIMIGGVTVNFLLALLIYSMCLYHWGDDYVAAKDMTLGMKFNSEAKALGFKDGDILLATDRGEFKDFSADMYRDLSRAKSVTLLRDGKEMTLTLPGDLDYLNMLKRQPQFVRPLIPAKIDSVLPQSIAESIGLKAGDVIKGVDGKDVDSYNEFINELGRHQDMLSQASTAADSTEAMTLQVAFCHDGDTVCQTATAKLDENMQLGFMVKSVAGIYDTTHVPYGFFESFPAGIKYGCNVLSGYVRDLKYVFTAEGAKSLGGFGAIGSLFPPMWDWHMFWLMTAFLSIILAFMNILPIPALDGGHVLFLIYEMITGRKPSEKFMIAAEYVGMGILILLMVVANLNDILRWIGVM